MYNIKVNELQLQALHGGLHLYANGLAKIDTPESKISSRIVRELALSLLKQQDEQRERVLAFERAIAAGLLSNDKDADNFAGNYMYMGTSEFSIMFMHIMTRECIHEPI